MLPFPFPKLLLSGLILCLTPYSTSWAFEWSNDYGASLGLGYDDNFRLTESDEIDTTSTNLGVFANLTGATEISSLRFSIGANAYEYSESTIEDTTGGRISMDASRRGEKVTGSLNLSYAKETTTETELFDSGEIVDGERETAVIAPSLSYMPNQRNTFTAALSSKDVSYDTVSFTEYTDNAVSVGWRYQLNETSHFSVSLRSSEYDPDEDDADAQRTDTNSVGLGYGWMTSEATSYSLSIGYSDVDRRRAPDSSGDYAFSVEHIIDERNNLNFSLSNSYQPSGEGDVRDEDRLNLRWNHGLSDRASVNVTAEAGSNDERDFYSLQAGASYSLSRNISLGASLRQRRQETDSTDADSTSIFFSLSYSSI